MLRTLTRRYVSYSSLWKSKDRDKMVAEDLMKFSDTPNVAELYVAWADNVKISDHSINVIMNYGKLRMEEREGQNEIIKDMFDVYRFAQEDLVLVPPQVGLVLLESCLMIDKDNLLSKITFESAWKLYQEIAEEKIDNPNSLRYFPQLAEVMLSLASLQQSTQTMQAILSHASKIGVSINTSIDPVTRYTQLQQGEIVRSKNELAIHALNSLLSRTDLPRPIKVASIKQLINDLIHEFKKSDNVQNEYSNENYAVWVVRIWKDAGLAAAQLFASAFLTSEHPDPENHPRKEIFVNLKLIEMTYDDIVVSTKTNLELKKKIIKALKQTKYSDLSQSIALLVVPKTAPELYSIFCEVRTRGKDRGFFAAQFLSRVINLPSKINNSVINYIRSLVNENSVIQWIINARCYGKTTNDFTGVTSDWEFLTPLLLSEVFSCCKNKVLTHQFAEQFISFATKPLHDLTLQNLLRKLRTESLLASDVFRRQYSLGITPSIESHNIIKDDMKIATSNIEECFRESVLIFPGKEIRQPLGDDEIQNSALKS